MINEIYKTEYWPYALEAAGRYQLAEKVKNCICIKLDGPIPPRFEVGRYLASKVNKDTRVMSSDETNGLLVRANYIVSVAVTDHENKANCEYYGPIEHFAEWEAEFRQTIPEQGRAVKWIYNEQGRTTTRYLSRRPVIRSAYPWMGESLEDYVSRFYASEACILVLIGPPGTGKTSLLKELIHLSGKDATLTYSEEAMRSDTLFANFMSDDETHTMIMEDADHFIADRKDGNKLMHKFLNLGDGLISQPDKKLIFTTNLPSVKSIDSALIRPGRCFDVMGFRSLTRSEAEAVQKEAGKTDVLPNDKTSFTLAEIMNIQPSAVTVPLSKTGFY